MEQCVSLSLYIYITYISAEWTSIIVVAPAIMHDRFVQVQWDNVSVYPEIPDQ